MKNEFSDPKEYYKHLSLFWTDLIHLMSSKPQALTSVGPMRNFAESAKVITKELLDANEDLVEFNEALTKYYKPSGFFRLSFQLNYCQFLFDVFFVNEIYSNKFEFLY